MKALEKLKEFSIKPSMQRIAIMDYLISNRTHPSIDDIYSSLFEEMPTLSKTTVYNTLKLFEEHKAVRTLTIDEKNICYDIDTAPHAHFICKCCNCIEDFNVPVATLKESANTAGYLITESHFYFKGICRKCVEASKAIINNN